MTQKVIILAPVTHKTGVHTLMMKLEIIMTTDIEVTSTQNIFQYNEVYNFDASKVGAELVLSAASFLINGAPNNSLVAVCKFIFSLIRKNMYGYEVWVIVGNSAWQPNTRIVRHRKLWGALKFQGCEILGGSDPQESFSEAHEKLKFFGAIKISKASIESMIELIFKERCSYIILVPENFKIKNILSLGWSGSLTEDLNLFHEVYKAGGLLFKRMGEFDDPNGVSYL